MSSAVLMSFRQWPMRCWRSRRRSARRWSGSRAASPIRKPKPRWKKRALKWFPTLAWVLWPPRSAPAEVPLQRVEVIQGDITRQVVDAIVNAANESLLGGGGVDGAIHRAAGPQLLEECRSLKGCPTGESRITQGYRLSAKWVIHTVGPIWRGGKNREKELLASCYRNCLELAATRQIQSIAFPSIGTGAYGFPMELAAEIAYSEMRSFLVKSDLIQKVVMVCFDRDSLQIHQQAFRLK